jgi:hypothetical protein
VSIIIDAMDHSKCTTPHCHAKPKDWDNAPHIQCQFAACLIHGVHTRMFAYDDELKKNSNLWGTVLVKVLVDEKKRRKDLGIPWPETLYFQGDNGKDNKNKEVFALGELMVRIGLFKKVKFSFLPKGHTHEDVDACFGAGSHMLHRMDAFDFEGILKLWQRGWPSTASFDYLHVSTQ